MFNAGHAEYALKLSVTAFILVQVRLTDAVETYGLPFACAWCVDRPAQIRVGQRGRHNQGGVQRLAVSVLAPSWQPSPTP